MENYLINAQKIHCIGIKGTGLSALAGILKEQGKEITGSDSNGPPHNPNNITGDVDLIIYSSAVPQDNVERLMAEKKGIVQLSYPEALGLLTREYKTIAVSGTHGKTTTTAMVAMLLQDLIDPTVLVGANVPELGGKNYRVGKGEYLIIEACEYQRHFLHYDPDIITLTNIEFDHPDYFESETDYKSAFDSFLMRLSDNGKIVANHDDPQVMEACSFARNIRTDIEVIPYGKDHHLFQQFRLGVPGEHNRSNALAALLTAEIVSPLDLQKAKQQLENFTGAGRRFEQTKYSKKTVIISDYAHHPTAIHATLKAARQKFGQDKKLLCVFQPHQYSRTIKLFNRFMTCFEHADEVIIPNIYQVRDTREDIDHMSAEKFVEELSQHHPHATYGHSLDKTLYDIKNRINDFDAVLIMGAGDVNKLAEALISSSR